MWGGGGLPECDPGGQRCSLGQELTDLSSLQPEPPDGKRMLDIKEVLEGWNLPICLCDVEEDKDEEGCYYQGKINICGSDWLVYRPFLWKQESLPAPALHKSKVGTGAAQVSSYWNLERKKEGALEERWCWLSQEMRSRTLRWSGAP